MRTMFYKFVVRIIFWITAQNPEAIKKNINKRYYTEKIMQEKKYK